MDSTPSPRRTWIASGLLAMLLVGGLGAGVAAIVIYTRDWARGQEATTPLAAIDCAAPPGLARPDFLTEVQYLSGLPDVLDLHDETLARTLANSFELHPWVDRVERVHVAPDKKICVTLTFRQPVLAVRHAGKLRAVDAAGVLLPPQAETTNLPVYPGVAAAPGVAGKPWADDGVLTAARAAGTSARAQ